MGSWLMTPGFAEGRDVGADSVVPVSEFDSSGSEPDSVSWRSIRTWDLAPCLHAVLLLALAGEDVIFSVAGDTAAGSSGLLALVVVLFGAWACMLAADAVASRRGLGQPLVWRHWFPLALAVAQVSALAASAYWRRALGGDSADGRAADAARLSCRVALVLLATRALYPASLQVSLLSSAAAVAAVVVFGVSQHASSAWRSLDGGLVVLAAVCVTLRGVAGSKDAENQLSGVACLFRDLAKNGVIVKDRKRHSRASGTSSSSGSTAAREGEDTFVLDQVTTPADTVMDAMAFAKSRLAVRELGPELRSSLDGFFDAVVRELQVASVQPKLNLACLRSLEGASPDMLAYVQGTLNSQSAAQAFPAKMGEDKPAALSSGMRRRSIQAFMQENALDTDSTVFMESESQASGSRRISTCTSVYSHTDAFGQLPLTVEQGLQAMMLPLVFRDPLRTASEGQLSQGNLEALQDMGKEVGKWRFDVFKISTLSDRRPLFVTGRSALSGLVKDMGLDMSRVENFLTAIEERYHSNNTYHNSLHAADVVNSMTYFLRLKVCPAFHALSDIDRLSALCASVAHDAGHTGKANRFHVVAETPLALLYNDQSVLENMHSAIASLVLHADCSNVLYGLDASVRAVFRVTVVEMILATDLGKHFQMVSRFKQEFLSNKKAREEERLNFEPTQRRELLSFVLKASDVGGSSKPFELHAQWTMRIMGEFFAQGDAEKELGLPFSPFCDRSETRVCQSQVGFFDFVVLPQYSAICEFLGSSRVNLEVMPELRQNLSFWKKWDGEGFNYKDPLSNWDVLRLAYVEWAAEDEEAADKKERKSASRRKNFLTTPAASEGRRGSHRVTPVSSMNSSDVCEDGDTEERPDRCTTMTL